MIARMYAYAALLLATAYGAEAQTTQERVWIGRNRDQMLLKLKDPSSAEFRNEYVSRQSGAPVACGEVNAKNGFGGRNGFQRWIGAIPAGVFLEQEVADFQKLWDAACKAPTSSSKPREHLPLAK